MGIPKDLQKIKIEKRRETNLRKIRKKRKTKVKRRKRRRKRVGTKTVTNKTKAKTKTKKKKKRTKARNVKRAFPEVEAEAISAKRKALKKSIGEGLGVHQNLHCIMASSTSTH